LQRTGKIMSWGVSNFDAGELQEVEDIAGRGRIACDQVLYHPGQRDIEHAVIPWCEAHGAAVVAYSPFGRDSFPGPRSPGGRALAEIARAHGATPRQVALAFLVRRANVFAIPKAASLAHIEENAGAGELQLAPDEIARIEAAFPLGRPLRSLPML
jgi:diketogulonate reductase-like aldo/keto reductase